MPARAVFALVSVPLAAAVAAAGPIVSPGTGPSYPPFPPPGSPIPYVQAFDGAPVPPAARVTTQHAGQGVVFEHTAYALIGGVGAWSPTGSQYLAGLPVDPLADTLNYSPGFNGVVSMHFADPTTGAPVGYDRVEVTFVGVPADRVALSVANGPYSTATWGANLPDGGPGSPPVSTNGPSALEFVELTADAPPGVGITNVNVYTMLFMQWPSPLPPWGVVSVRLGNVVPTGTPAAPAETPEPSSLLLGLIAAGVGATRLRAGRG